MKLIWMKKGGVPNFTFDLIHNLMSVYSTAGIAEQIKPLQGLFGFPFDV